VCFCDDYAFPVLLKSYWLFHKFHYFAVYRKNLFQQLITRCKSNYNLQLASCNVLLVVGFILWQFINDLWSHKCGYMYMRNILTRTVRISSNVAHVWVHVRHLYRCPLAVMLFFCVLVPCWFATLHNTGEYASRVRYLEFRIVLFTILLKDVLQ
jgi:hypothetical protein